VASYSDSRRVHPLVEKLAAYSWRLIAIGVVALAALWLLSRLRLAVIPVVIAVFVTRILAPVHGWLCRHRWRRGLAAVATILAFLLLIAALGAVIGPILADEAGSVEPAVNEALDDVEDWLVENFDVSRETVQELRIRTERYLRDLARTSDGDVVGAATLAAEVVASAILAILLTFFMLRDGRRFMAWAYERFRPELRPRLRRAGDRGWATLGFYLRGAALLGVVEAIAIGLTLWLAGGSLVAPVMVLTFVAAFIPIIGAAVAGVVAVMVGLVTGGAGTAIIVAIVALVVQQLDNDLLAPVIYGRALRLHPVTILLGVVAGGELFGLVGTILAVPVIAVVINMVKELRASAAAVPTPAVADETFDPEPA
jgi:predicted PurR-regulated permease PerM